MSRHRRNERNSPIKKEKVTGGLSQKIKKKRREADFTSSFLGSGLPTTDITSHLRQNTNKKAETTYIPGPHSPPDTTKYARAEAPHEPGSPPWTRVCRAVRLQTSQPPREPGFPSAIYILFVSIHVTRLLVSNVRCFRRVLGVPVLPPLFSLWPSNKRPDANLRSRVGEAKATPEAGTN